MKTRMLTLAAIALCCYAAEADKTVLVLGARAGDAERIGAGGAEAYRSRGYRIVNAALAGSGLNLRADLTVATRRSQVQAEVARLIALGARHVDVGQGEQSWVVLADPEGNEFCVLS